MFTHPRTTCMPTSHPRTTCMPTSLLSYLSLLFLLLLVLLPLLLAIPGSERSAPRGPRSRGPPSNRYKTKTLQVISPTQTESLHADCFTQGLVHHQDYLLESCGLVGKSKIQKVNPATGAVLASRNLPADIFAEGLVVVGRFAYLLTWKNELLFVFDVESLDVVKTMPLISSNKEGWGLTHDGHHLILSDGSHILTYLAIR